MFNVHTASAAVLVVVAACLGLGHAFAGVLLVLLLLTYSRTRMLVAGLEVAVWLLLVNRRAERTALVPRRHRWPWAVAGCFPSRPARVRPRSPSCGGGRARAARTRGSASLPCGGARFRFGTVRVGMRRVGAGTSRAGPRVEGVRAQGARPRQARPSRVGVRDFASEQFGAACGASFPRVARSIYAMTGSSRPYAASNATCLRSFTRQLCSSSSRPDL